ncbi:MAG TPA: hypothetical protein VNN77_15780 [candidate division Zixibacteria bacterium]|nr:hypothetical protein [candidate division Zixibacteria bacterium]
MLRKGHIDGFARHTSLNPAVVAKKGKDGNPSPSPLAETKKKTTNRYLVFVPSSFFSIGAAGWSAGAFCSPAGAAGSAGAGAGAGAAGGGGGGAGSSFLPHPANVRVKAKSVTPDKIANLFILFTSFPVTHL